MTPDPRDLMRGLDGRERAVLVAFYEHKVLVTEHLKAMFFGSVRRAQDRLRHLAQRGFIDTWYPPQPRGMGKASGHHTLTENGAHVVASLLGIARSELRYVVRDEKDREQDSYLAHRIGVNEFFCTLIKAGRTNDDHGLAKWVPERTVKTSDGWIRPDGFGVYLHPGGALDFYLEYDRGTETTRQLANKLAGYIGVAKDWTEQGAEHFPCVLIVVPNHKRERIVAAAFADALGAQCRHGQVVASASSRKYVRPPRACRAYRLGPSAPAGASHERSSTAVGKGCAGRRGHARGRARLRDRVRGRGGDRLFDGTQYPEQAIGESSRDHRGHRPRGRPSQGRGGAGRLAAASPATPKRGAPSSIPGCARSASMTEPPSSPSTPTSRPAPAPDPLSIASRMRRSHPR